MRVFKLIAFVFVVSSQILSAQMYITTISEGDPRVDQYNFLNGNFNGQISTLNVSGVNYGNNSDIEFDGLYYYGISWNDPTVRKFNINGQFIGDIATLRIENFPGQPNGTIPYQIGLAIDGNYFYSIGRNDYRVRQYDKSGKFLGDFCNLHDQNGTISSQTGITLFNNYFYTIAYNDSRVRKFDLNGAFIGDVVLLSNPNASQFVGTGISINNVPEPSALSLLAIGLGGLAILRLRRS